MARVRMSLLTASFVAVGLSLAAAAEQIYVAQNNPAVVHAYEFDGRRFVTQVLPGSVANGAVAGGFDILDVAITDRFYVIATGLQALAISIVDRATGVELPRPTTTVQFGSAVATAPDGQFAFIIGRDPQQFATLDVIDLRPASPTFDSRISSIRLDLVSNSSPSAMTIDPTGRRILAAVQRNPNTPSSIVAFTAVDIADPARPAVIAQTTATGGGAQVWSLRQFSSGGKQFVVATRAGAQIYELLADGSLRFVQELASVTAGGVQRLYRDVVFATTGAGDRLFATTSSAMPPGVTSTVREIVVSDMTRVGGGFDGTIVASLVLSTAIDGANDAQDQIVSSVDGAYLFIKHQGVEASVGGELVAVSQAELLGGRPGAVLDTIAIDATPGIVAVGAGLVVASSFATPPAPPTVSNVSIEGVTGRVLVNDQPRTIGISGSGLESVTKVFVGLTSATIVTVTGEALTATVQRLAPAQTAPVLVVGANGSARGTLTIANAPTYLPAYQVFSAAGAENRLYALNAATKMEVTTSFPTGATPADPVVSSDGRLLFAQNFRATTVWAHTLFPDYPTVGTTIYQRIADAEVGPNPQRSARHPVRPRLYVANAGGGIKIIDIDPSSSTFGRAIWSLPTNLPTDPNAGFRGTRSVALSPDGNYLYVGRSGNPFLLVVDVRTDKPTALDVTPVSIPDPVPASASRTDGLAFSPSGDRLYFSTFGETQIRVFDTTIATGPKQIAVIALPDVSGALPTVPLVPDVRRIQVLPDNRFVYVSGRTRGAVDVIDPAAQSVVTTIPMDGFAGEPAVAPSSEYVFVAASAIDSIVTIDARSTVNGSANPALNTIVAKTFSGRGTLAAAVSPGVATAAGANVVVEPAPGTSVTFTSVTQPGGTTITSSNVSGLTLPPHFAILGLPVFFDVRTSATFTGTVTVCFTYDDRGLTRSQEIALRLLHEVGGTMRDVTRRGYPDIVANRICGDVSSFSQFVVAAFVNQAPIANAGPSPSAFAGPSCSAAVTLDGSDSFDPDGDAITWAWSGPFGVAAGATPTAVFPLGKSTATLTVTDELGASSLAVQTTVTVVDGTPPVVTQASAAPPELWPPNHKMAPVNVAVSLRDNCDSDASCRIVGVTSSEPPNGATPLASAQWQVTDALTVMLRAERAGDAGDRLYTVTLQCEDASKNVTTRTVFVRVPHDRGRH